MPKEEDIKQPPGNIFPIRLTVEEQKRIIAVTPLMVNTWTSAIKLLMSYGEKYIQEHELSN